jgi:SAM-dependent methyltransferase
MSRATRSLPPGYFEALYARDPDPWCFADSTYEREKYAATLAALPRPRYARALEVGCSIGVLTRELAPRCAALLAVDAARAPLEAARARCAGLPQVTFFRMQVPGEWPEEAAPCDLILLSEVVYYLDAMDVARLAARIGAGLAPGGDVLLVHWTGETDYPLSGDEATERFIAAASFADVTRQDRTARYRLDLLRAR